MAARREAAEKEKLESALKLEKEKEEKMKLIQKQKEEKLKLELQKKKLAAVRIFSLPTRNFFKSNRN